MKNKDKKINKEKYIKIYISMLAIFLITVICSIKAYAADMEYEYDDSGRVTKVTYEDGSYETYEYDGNGNIVRTDFHQAEEYSNTTEDTTEDASEDTVISVEGDNSQGDDGDIEENPGGSNNKEDKGEYDTVEENEELDDTKNPVKAVWWIALISLMSVGIFFLILFLRRKKKEEQIDHL